MKCSSCRKTKDISFLAYESMIDQMERMNRRLFILNLILVILLFAGVIFFFWYDNQFEDVVTTQTVEQDGLFGNNNLRFVGSDYNGLSESDGYNEETYP